MQLLWDCINNIPRPFGHELMLFTLLTVADPCAYMWNMFQEETFDLYDDGMLLMEVQAEDDEEEDDDREEPQQNGRGPAGESTLLL